MPKIHIFHKLKSRMIRTCFVICLISLFVVPTNILFAQTFNKQINYQGKLTNSSGVAVTDGDYNLEFKIYTASSGGSAVWTESRTAANRVTVTNGMFSVMLGEVTPITSIDWNQTLYLGVNVGGSGLVAIWDGEMTPRKVLGSVPSAFQSDKLDDLDSTQFVRSDAVSTIAVSSADTALSINQTGAGNLVNFQASGTSIFSLNNAGLASTSALKVSGNATVGTLTATGLTSVADMTVSGGITLGGEYRTAWPSGGSSGYWATTTNSLIGYPSLAGDYAIVVGAAATTSDNIKFEVLGNTKLGGDLVVTGNATTSGRQYVGDSLVVGSLPDALSLSAGDLFAENLKFNASSSIYSLENDLVFQDGNGGVKTLSQLIAGPTGCSDSNSLISGGQATYSGTGFIYDVPATVYCIGGLQYSITSTQVTLADADPDEDRIDVITVNSSGQVIVLTGETSANPIAPASNPATQLDLTFVYIKAGAVLPGVDGTGPRQELMYLEDTEWVGTQSFPNGGVVSFSSVVDPQAGSKNIEVTTPLKRNGYFQFASSSAVWDPTGYTYFSFYIKNKTAWTANTDRLDITFRNNTNTQLGSSVRIQHNTYGFDKNNTSAYQKITIPLSAFGTLGQSIKYVRFTTGSGSSLNTFDFRVDGITAQGPSIPSGSNPTTGLSGTGLSGQLTFWTGTSTMAGSSGLVWNNTTQRLGIGTSTPGVALGVMGSAIFAGNVNASNFTSTSTTVASTFPYASTTALTVSGNAYLGSLTGPLQAINGLVSASSTLSVAYGGTGATTFTSNGILYGNGTSALQATAAGTNNYLLYSNNGTPAWTNAPTILGTNITGLSADNISAGTLSIARGGTGQTAFAQGWLSSDGSTITSSTSPTVNYITATSTTATSTFAGSLSVNGGGYFTDTDGDRVDIAVNNRGVALYVVAGSGWGIQGFSSNGDYGILGGDGMGVHGVGSNYGGIFENNSATGYGLKVNQSNASGYAVYSDGGKNYFSGNVGIGTTSPYAPLSVNGQAVALYYTATSTTATSTFAGGLTVNGNTLVVDYSSGKVGVGTTTAGLAKLTVDYTPTAADGTFIANYTNLDFVGSAGDPTGKALYVRSYTPDLADATMYGIHSQSYGGITNYGIYSESLNGDSVYGGYFKGTGDAGTDTAYGLYGTASGGSSKNWAGYFNAGNVFIANNLAIGTSSPTQLLHLAKLGGDAAIRLEGNYGEETLTEKITNGGFTGGTTDWSITGDGSLNYSSNNVVYGGEIDYPNTYASYLTYTASNPITAGRTYRVTFTVTFTDNWVGTYEEGVTAIVGGTSGTKRVYVSTAPVTYTQDIVAGSDGTVSFKFEDPGSTEMQITFDTVSVLEVGENAVATNWTFGSDYSDGGKFKIANSSALGTSDILTLNTSGNVTAMYASTTALTVSGTAYLGSLTGPLQAINGVVSATSTLSVHYGGTGISTYAIGDLVYANGTKTLGRLADVATGGILVSGGVGAAPSWIRPGQGWLHADGTNTITSSTSPTVNYLTATSTTATSTFAGGLTVDGNTLVVDYSSGNVGIGVTNPKSLFQIGAQIDSRDTYNTPTRLRIIGSNVQSQTDETLIRLARSTADGAYYNASADMKLGAYSTGLAPSTRLTFTLKSASTFDEAPTTDVMSLLANGNVGVGTTSPGARLHISTTNANFATTPLEVARLESAFAGFSTLEVGSGPALTFYVPESNAGSLSEGQLGAQIAAVRESSIDSNASTSLVFWTAGNDASPTEKMRITSDGNVGIGTTVPNEGKLEVKGGTVCVDTDSNGTAASCIANESDERLKKNVDTLSGSLDKILSLRGVEFDWKVGDEEVEKHYPLINRFAGNPHSVGLIAQEVEKILPEAIMAETVGDGVVQYKQLDYDKFIPLLIEGMKEQQVLIKDSNTVRVSSSDTLESGDLVVSSSVEEVKKGKRSDNLPVLGVVVDKTAKTLGLTDRDLDKYLVAFSNRVEVKISTENGEIKAGDYITISNISGIGMKATSSGVMIGQALEDFDPNLFSDTVEDENGNEFKTGKITVFINLGYSRLTPQIKDGEIVYADQDIWTVDTGTGQIKPLASLDLNNLDINNIKAIRSASGNWSLTEDGVLVVKEIQADKLCLGQTCVTELELKYLLQTANISGLSVTTPTTTEEGEDLSIVTPSDMDNEEEASTTPTTNNETEVVVPPSGSATDPALDPILPIDDPDIPVVEDMAEEITPPADSVTEEVTTESDQVTTVDTPAPAEVSSEDPSSEPSP